MRSVELFAGAGGLAIGMAAAGFRHVAVIENDPAACETFRENQRLHSMAVDGWPLFEGDARSFDYAGLASTVDVVSGGPPCQPFSTAGKHEGERDDRDMFPEAVRAIRVLRPKAFVFENVKGLLRDTFSSYFSYVILQLQHPEFVRRRSEGWPQHRSRLERHHTAAEAPTYNVVFQSLNAADYGVAQRRERVFIVGFRADLGISWSFPPPTHSEDALAVAKWISGSYWRTHKIRVRDRPPRSPRQEARLGRLGNYEEGALERWRTVRDALAGLPHPQSQRAPSFVNHSFIAGARTYHGHTGSSLDEPAKTLKAGRHGVPGGENMVVLQDGSVRYFTIREMARLQTFPDEYCFRGTRSQTIRQLGNAVPVKLAQVVARSVAASLAEHQAAAMRSEIRSLNSNPAGPRRQVTGRGDTAPGARLTRHDQ